MWQTLKKSKWVDVFTYDGQVTTLLDHNHDAPAIKRSNDTINNDVTDGQVGDNVIHYPLQYPPASGSEAQQVQFNWLCLVLYGFHKRTLQMRGCRLVTTCPLSKCNISCNKCSCIVVTH